MKIILAILFMFISACSSKQVLDSEVINSPTSHVSYDEPRSASEIGLTMDHYQSGIASIYNKMLSKNKDLEGDLTLSLTFDLNGKVQNCKIHDSTIDNAELSNKLIDYCYTIQFGKKSPLTNKIETNMNYPIEFRAK